MFTGAGTISTFIFTCDLLAVLRCILMYLEEGVSLDTITAYIYDTIWRIGILLRYLDENFPDGVSENADLFDPSCEYDASMYLQRRANNMRTFFHL